MAYDIEYDDQDLHYRCVVIRLKNEFQFYRCGYVSVPNGHSFYGQHYDYKIACDLNSVKVNPTDTIGTVLAMCGDPKTELPIGYLAFVHGGITYATKHDDIGKAIYPVTGQGWWFGFDAAHLNDIEDGGRSLHYMVQECKKLRDFLKSHEKINEEESPSKST
jgi:hypothetical protein